MKWSRWNPFLPFGREKADVVRILEGILAGSLDCREWGNFVDIPMKGTPDLEEIRKACQALEAEESMDNDGRILHTERARAELQRLLDGLRKNA